MIMKKIITSITFIALSFVAIGQGTADALRYSRMNYQGTARFNAMGGSFGALGGEISSININPAGIGVYRNSEFTFSTALLTNNTDTKFGANSFSDNAVNFNIPNIGFVSSYKGDANGWKTFSLGFGHSRVNNFKSDYILKGSNNSSSSFLDPYVSTLNQNFPSTDALINYEAFPFGPAQAFNTFAIDIFQDPNGEFYDRWLLGEESINQTKKVQSRGRQSETYAAFGGNYQDKLYLGANVAVQGLRYEEEVIRSEKYTYATPPPAGVVDINEYREQTSLLTRGTGFNFKVGFIYRINQSFRFGGSVHSPTYFSMSEEYSMESLSQFSDGNAYKSEEVISNYNYQYRTPMRYNASLAYIYGRNALFNVDYEYVDFSKATFDDYSDNRFDFSSTNNEIKRFLTAAHNLRFGTEIRFDPFVARAGFRYEGNPYSNQVFFNPNESRKTYSLGGGFRVKNFNIDLAYALSQMNFIDPFYENAVNIGRIATTDHLVTATVGWKW